MQRIHSSEIDIDGDLLKDAENTNLLSEKSETSESDDSENDTPKLLDRESLEKPRLAPLSPRARGSPAEGRAVAPRPGSPAPRAPVVKSSVTAAEREPVRPGGGRLGATPGTSASRTKPLAQGKLSPSTIPRLSMEPRKPVPRPGAGSVSRPGAGAGAGAGRPGATRPGAGTAGTASMRGGSVIGHGREAADEPGATSPLFTSHLKGPSIKSMFDGQTAPQPVSLSPVGGSPVSTPRGSMSPRLSNPSSPRSQTQYQPSVISDPGMADPGMTGPAASDQMVDYVASVAAGRLILFDDPHPGASSRSASAHPCCPPPCCNVGPGHHHHHRLPVCPIRRPPPPRFQCYPADWSQERWQLLNFWYRSTE